MEHICLSLGPSQVSCLTGVRASGNDDGRLEAFRVYRRPSAFSRNRFAQILPLSVSFLEIVLHDRPRLLQLAVCDDGYIALLAKRWLNLPFVVYAHGNEILEALQMEWDKPRLALQNASRVLANSRFTANLVEKAGVSRDNITVIPLGCDVERFYPHEPSPETTIKLLGKGKEGPVILTVGNIVERKGHDMVIKALPMVEKWVPGVTYLIVGTGPHKSRLEDLALSLGVRDRVIFTGKVSDEELPDCYALCDVFAMPSRARSDFCDVEGFGLVFLEAAACGKPVVGGRSGGVEEAVVDGTTGLLVDPCDPEDVGRAIVLLLTTPDLCHKLGEQGLDRVRREFTWGVVGMRIQQILEQVVKSDA